MKNTETYERAFLTISAVMLVIFLGALLYSSVVMGISVPTRVGNIDPRTVRTTPPFDNPGLRQLGPDSVEVVILGQAWSFVPNEIRIPAGTHVTFIGTSADVVHGFELDGTRINMMLLPGEISRASYRFEEPGEHLLICHEYCGAGHHAMFGRVIVE